MELDFKEAEFIKWWEKYYGGSPLEESHRGVAEHGWNARHMNDYFGEKEDDMRKP